MGEVTLLSVAKVRGPFGEAEKEEASGVQGTPRGAAADPMQELRDLEEALEQYQAEGEEGPEDWANNEDWEVLSSGSN